MFTKANWTKTNMKTEKNKRRGKWQGRKRKFAGVIGSWKSITQNLLFIHGNCYRLKRKPLTESLIIPATVPTFVWIFHLAIWYTRDKNKMAKNKISHRFYLVLGLIWIMTGLSVCFLFQKTLLRVGGYCTFLFWMTRTIETQEEGTLEYNNFHKILHSVACGWKKIIGTVADILL